MTPDVDDLRAILAASEVTFHRWQQIMQIRAHRDLFCKATIIIDGVIVQTDKPPTIDEVHPGEVGAIEVYRAGEETMAPVEYHIGKCGGIVIWTRR